MKFKLLALTIVLLASALIAQFYLSITEYKKDKVAYVFDSALQGSKSTSLLLNTDLKQALERVTIILSQPLSEGLVLNSRVRSYIKGLKEVRGFYILNQAEGQGYKVTSSVFQPGKELSQKVLQGYAQKLKEKKLIIGKADVSQNTWFLAIPLAKKVASQAMAIVELEDSSFMESFHEPKLQNFYLLDSQKNILMQPHRSPYEVAEGSLSSIFAQLQWDANAASQVKKVKLSNEKVYLLAVTRVGIGDFYVASVIPEEVALEALKLISIKTGLLLLLLLGISIIVSVLGANGLTKNLSKLYVAVTDVIKGNLDVKVDIRSKDEVGTLANGFNIMTTKIQELLNETAEKVRMEGELNTAKMVQETLLPENHFKNDKLEISGFYESASECGGDWYSYLIQDNKAYVWIGDATGHGVSAALITSAAKSAAVVMQKMPHVTTDVMVSLMNQAIHETSKGNVLMTLFVGCLDLETGDFSCTNASHEVPYLFHAKGDEYSRADIEPLLVKPGPRLGQSEKGEYESVEFKLKPGDRIVFYTDGLTELTNTKGQQLGEGKFLRHLVKAFNKSTQATGITEEIINLSYQFREGEHLHDDVTLFTLEYHG